MQHSLKAALTGAVGVAGVAALMAVPTAAFAANTTSNRLSYEFDNGSTWTLDANTSSFSSTYRTPGYSDAGIVVDLGPLVDLTSTSGASPIQVAGTGVVDNIWISDGASEANIPGTHALSDAPDFAYGFDNGNGTFWMSTNPNGTTGDNSLSTLQQEYQSAEAYAWVGVVYGGTGSVSGNVSAVNGHSVGNRSASITENGDGTVTAVIH